MSLAETWRGEALVLIVDDERDNRELYEIVLSRAGFQVRTANDGEEALRSIVAHRPNLVLLDVMMPGMDGYEVVAAIKGDPATSDICVLMVTALDDRSVRERAMAAGANDVLRKPLDRAELCRYVNRVLTPDFVQVVDEGK